MLAKTISFSSIYVEAIQLTSIGLQKKHLNPLLFEKVYSRSVYTNKYNQSIWLDNLLVIRQANNGEQWIFHKDKFDRLSPVISLNEYMNIKNTKKGHKTS